MFCSWFVCACVCMCVCVFTCVCVCVCSHVCAVKRQKKEMKCYCQSRMDKLLREKSQEKKLVLLNKNTQTLETAHLWSTAKFILICGIGYSAAMLLALCLLWPANGGFLIGS